MKSNVIFQCLFSSIGMAIFDHLHSEIDQIIDDRFSLSENELKDEDSDFNDSAPNESSEPENFLMKIRTVPVILM